MDRSDEDLLIAIPHDEAAFTTFYRARQARDRDTRDRHDGQPAGTNGNRHRAGRGARPAIARSGEGAHGQPRRMCDPPPVIKVHILDTGRVQIHYRQVEPHPRDALRIPATLIDRRWTDWLAIWSFAIEHPDGLVVVDAGQDPDHTTPWWDVFTRVATRFDATDADRLDVRLREAGLDPGAVRLHVFTHLHIDHVGAGTLPGATPVIHADEWRAATRPGARLTGLMHPNIREPILVDDEHDVHGDGSIVLLATPGHTAGHQSVLVTPTRGPRVLISGDAVYSERALLSRTIDGVGMDPRRARASIDRLRDIVREAPTVVAPTHDPQAKQRLMSGTVTHMSEERADARAR